MIVKIVDFSDDYRGIALLNDKKYFVENAVVGDEVEVEIIEEKSKYGIAKIKNYIKKSDNRIENNSCKYFGKCGGCSLFYCENKYYLEMKRRKLVNAIKKSGYNANVDEIFSVGFSKRRRINLKYNNGTYGFCRKNSNDVVDIDFCANVTENINKVIKLFKNLKFQNLDSVDIFEVNNFVNVALIFKGEPKIEEFNQLDVFENQDIIISYTHEDRKKYISIMDRGNNLRLNLSGIHILLPENCFLQATEESQNFMIDLIKKEVKKNYNTIADLYCGIGTYTFPLSKENCKIYSFEGNDIMIDNIKRNIIANNIKNIFPEKRDLFNQPLSRSELNEFKMIIINPPRNGAESQCKNIVKSNVEKVIYVSCNPQSLSRDLKLFFSTDFRITKVVLVDQFYLSEHVESVIVLEK